MKFVYKPEGAAPQAWDFDPTKLMSPEVEVIERHTGFTFMEWVEALGRGSFGAFHGLLFVMLKRSRPTLKWDEVQFCMADVGWDLDVDDMREQIGNLEDKAKTPAGLLDNEADLLESLRKQLAEAEGEGAVPLEPTP